MSEEFEKPLEPVAYRPVKKQGDSTLPVILSACSLFVALAAIIIVFVTARPEPKSAEAKGGSGNINIAWINTDTIWSNYDFVNDVKDELAKLEKDLQDQYAATVTAFQNEYNNYLKTGSTMSLAEQKRKEEALAKKQQDIQELDASLTQQLVDEKTARNMEVHDTIINYVNRFNRDKIYTFILERSYAGNVMYADSTLEITSIILEGLNQEYKAIRKSKESAKEK